MQLDKPAEILKQGGIIIYPSETSYGFTCDATNEKAIKRVYEIKQRPETKPFIVLFHSINQAKEFLHIDEDAEKLSKMPSVSIIVKNKSLKAYKNKVAFRIPQHEISQKLLSSISPLTTTSANLSNEDPIYSSFLLSKFKDKVDLIIDQGDLPKNDLTTVYEISSKKIIRQGAVTKEEIEEFLK